LQEYKTRLSLPARKRRTGPCPPAGLSAKIAKLQAAAARTRWRRKVNTNPAA
jgi:hypothetical protein